MADAPQGQTDLAPKDMQPGEDSPLSSLREIKLAAALACGALALCFASFPAVSWLTKPLSGIGLALGLFGCWLPARKHGDDLRLPSAVVGLSAVVLAFVGSWPKPSAGAPAPLVAVSLNPDDIERHALDNGQWTDASERVVSLNDVHVQVSSARIETVALTKASGPSTTTADKYLVIRLHVSYEGIVFKQFHYERWADTATAPSKHRPVLVDDEGQPIEQAKFGAGRSVPSELGDEPFVIYGRPLDDVLVFPAPSRIPEYWLLTLPASAFGQAGEYKFHIPRSMVESNQ